MSQNGSITIDSDSRPSSVCATVEADSRSKLNEEVVIDYDLLYDSVQEFQKSAPLPTYSGNVQHEDLVPTLRPYQSDAVRWAVLRELENPLKGGILADEMGLGKTVEVLAVILNNPRENVPTVEWKEPIRMTTEPAKPATSPKKSKKDACEKCAYRTIYKSIENVIWRFNPDNEKSVIQGVIDEYCSKIVEKKRPQCSCSDPNIRARLNAHYNNALAQYSGLRSLQNRQSVESEEVKTICICGEPNSNKAVIQCPECKKQQHTSCVGYNQSDPYRGEYFCPQCWIRQDTIPSKATLIVTPSSICHQWVEEIKRHIKRENFNVLVYQGVAHQGYMQPLHLATKYDVIITTYDVLRRELYFADVKIQSGEKRRRTVTYMAPPSPLLSVEFWRQCLDEAQMVEGSTTRAAEMARKFRTVHRWCVTGTPIQKSVFDLYGLFLFLNVEQYEDRKSFSDSLETPFKAGNLQPLVETLAPIFRRVRKSQVTDQVQIPPQEERIHWLKFSPLEEHFYQQQHQLCRTDALERFCKFGGLLSSKISSVDRHTINHLLFPLLRLRQACVHPQMVRGQFVALRHVTLTMEELLVTLIKRAQLECEESQRLRVAASNGLAALHIIRREWAEAAEKYRDVLRWAEELKDTVKTDTLQRIHALHNLAEVLQSAPQGSVPPTLRDDKLTEEAAELKKQYLERSLAQVQAAQSNLAPLTSRISVTKQELEANRAQLNDLWWTAVLQFTVEHNLAEKLVTEIREKLEEEARNVPTKVPSISNKFRDVNGLKFLLFSGLEEVDEQRQLVAKRMRSLEIKATETLSLEAADCHLRPLQGRKKKDRCLLCTVHDDIEDYESLLFRMDDRKTQDHEDSDPGENGSEDVPTLLETLRRGTWADSELEKMMKIILQFSRKAHVPAAIQEGGAIQIRLFEAYKKEFRHIRILWRQFNDQASAIDELSMATLRLRIRLPHEIPDHKPTTSKATEKSTNSTPIYLLEPHEVDVQRSKLQSDLISATNSLKRHSGHVLYLKNLERAGFGRSGNQNPDPCPVCRSQLGSKWSVLLCGHSFCMECVQLLINQCGSRRLRCAICREWTDLSDIAYVDTQPEADDPAVGSPLRVKGSHSTKVEAVVKQILSIKSQDPEAKCLVFSTWIDVLLIISRALDQNDVTYCTLFSHNGQNSLNRFRREPNVTCLLIPVQSGANGLNLIEATHVLLVEPILNPGSELQAIGRVHRIGQTKPTVVHRFLVRNTVEEKMALMLDKHRSTISSKSSCSSRENPVTLADLKALFDEN